MTTGTATVTVLAAVARNGVIGRGGALPWRLAGDLQRFKATTLGHVLVMGRRTFDSIGRPLPGRTTVVVTRQPDWRSTTGAADVLTAGSVDAALRLAATIDPAVFVAGGAQVYAEALRSADRLQISWVDAEPEGDARFPTVDWEQWVETQREAYDGWAAVAYVRKVSQNA